MRQTNLSTRATCFTRSSNGLAKTTQDAAIAAYGRWLGFIATSEPVGLAAHPVDRLTVERLAHLDHLAETAGTVGRHMFLAKLRDAVRVNPARDWSYHIDLMLIISVMVGPYRRGAALMLAASAITIGLSRSALNFDPAKTQVRR
jgi:hypothetical protein